MDKLFKLTNDELDSINLVQYKKKLYQFFNVQQNPHEKSAIALHIESVILPTTQNVLNYPPKHIGEIITETQLIDLWKRRLLCYLYLFYVDNIHPLLFQIVHHLNFSMNYSSSMSLQQIIWSGAQHFPPERRNCILIELNLLLRLVSLSFNISSSSEYIALHEISEYVSEINLNNPDIQWLKKATLNSLFSRENSDEVYLFQQIQFLATSTLLAKVNELRLQHDLFSLKGTKNHGLFPKLLNDKQFPSPSKPTYFNSPPLSNSLVGFEESLNNTITISPLSKFEAKFYRPTPPLLEFNPDYEFLWINDVNTYSTTSFTNEMKQNTAEFKLDPKLDIDNTHLFCLYELNSTNKGGFMSSNHQRSQQQSVSSSETSNSLQSSNDGLVLMKRGKTTQENEMNELFSKAFKQQLQPVQIKYLLQNFDKLTMLTDLLTPNRLTDLVKNNREVASKCLQVLIHSNNKRLDEYLSVLVSIPVSLQLLEAVNNLLNKTDKITTGIFTKNLEDSNSSSYLHILLRNCITHCNQSMQDPPSQTRKVRLICVFVQRLIREEILVVNHDDFIFMELQSFCIEFMKIKEAADLFQLLKEKI